MTTSISSETFENLKKKIKNSKQKNYKQTIGQSDLLEKMFSDHKKQSNKEKDFA